MTREELANRWECHVNTIKNLVKDGFIKCYPVNQFGRMDFPEDEVAAFEEKRNIPPKGERVYIDEVIESLGISKKDVYKLVKDGKIRHGRLTDTAKKFYFYKGDLK